MNHNMPRTDEEVKADGRKAMVERQMAEHREHYGEQTEPVRVGPKVGRNDRCPCGSGEKFKRCCLGREDAETRG